MKEFDPILAFNRTLDSWWVTAIAVFLGGLLGFVFSNFHAPVYEATARFYVTVDVSRYGELKISERDEDLALASIADALWSNEVIQAVDQESRAQNLNVNMATLVQDSALERGNAFWYLRYRSTDRITAQAFVNLWAEKGYQTVLARLADHTLVDYVKFCPPTLASVPTAPVEYNRNKLMVAGALLGLVAGILLSNLISKPLDP
jgi:hypothetical protein